MQYLVPKQEPKKPPTKDEAFDQDLGFDPGYREYIACNMIETNDMGVQVEQKYMYSNRKCQHEVGFHARKWKL